MMCTGKVVLVLGMLAPSSIVAWAQATPTATASPVTESLALPDLPGTLGFSVSASGGENIGVPSTTHFTAVSGNAAYLSSSLDKSFSLLYSGGYSDSLGYSSSFQNLSFSQSLLTKSWNLLVSDVVSYLPQTPTVGLAGLAGLGDLDLSAVQQYAGQGILTNSAQRISNVVSASAGYKVTGRTTITESGSYLLQDFLDSPGSLNSTQVMGMGGVSHQVDALSSLGGNYTYSRFSYPSVPLSFIVQQANVQYSRQWSRKLQTSVTIGPEWISNSGASSGSPTTSFSANAQLNYNLRNVSANVSYIRGVQGGDGIIPGSSNDSLSCSLNQRIGLAWNLSWLARYGRNDSLKQTSVTPFSSEVIIGGAQISRHVGRSLSAYASYTAQRQSTSGALGSSNIYNGLSHIVGFGLTYSPSLIHLGHQ